MNERSYVQTAVGGNVFTLREPDELTSNTITLSNEKGVVVGRLSFKEETVQFTGDTNEAGGVFFSFLSKVWSNAFTEARDTGFESGKLYGRRSPIELVAFDSKTDFKRAYRSSQQIVEDSQTRFPAGSPYDTQRLLDSAVDDIRVGDLVKAASMLLAIADRTGLLAEPISDGPLDSWRQAWPPTS